MGDITLLKNMGYDNQPGDFTLPTKFTAKRAAEVARRKKIPTPSTTAPQEEKQTAIKKKQEIQHTEEINTEIKSKEPKIETKKKEEKKATVKTPVKENTAIERSEMSLQREETSIEDLKNAKTKDELANIIIDYLTAIFERGALLLVTKTHIVGWQGGGEGIYKNIVNVSIPLGVESVFKHVIDNQRYYSGMWNPQKGDYLFYESLEITRSDDIIVVPVILNNKVFALLYTDNYKVNPHHITPSSIEVEGLVNVAKEFSKACLRIIKK